MRFWHYVFLVLLTISAGAAAKRAAPMPVTPVVNNGVMYSADGDGRTEYVVATDSKSRKELWRLKIFTTEMEPGLEEDVQWVFITELKYIGNRLVVRDEKSRCYSLDPVTKKVSKRNCWLATHFN